ncbi:retrovirus-related pol polyprotein from transposon TNT 1-94 [Tanacetum coccineum]
MADDQSMWGNNRAMVPTLEAAIIAVDLEDNFTVKGHHLSVIKDRQFDGRARADPHNLPSEWKTHALIWRNKEEIETINLDDLYNNLKIYEPELTGSTNTSQNSQNVAFMSSNSTNSNSNSSTNEVDNTTYGVSVAHTQSNPTSGDNLIDVVICAFLSYQAEEEHPTNFALMAYTSSRSSSNPDSKTLTTHYKKYGAMFEERINVLNLEVKLRDNALVKNKKKLEKAEKERDELKLTLEKFQNSSKSLNNLLESQVCDKFKTDKDLMCSFGPVVRKDFKSENMDVITVVTPSNVKKVESNHESADLKNNGDAVEPKTVRKNSFNRASPLEDWNSLYDDSEVIKRMEKNNSSRVNHKNFANKMTHPHLNRRFFLQAILTRSGKIKTVSASVNTTIKPVNTVGSKLTVNHPRPISNTYKKGYSQVTRPFNKYSANKNNIFNKKVNTVRVKDTTARDRAVVSENKENKVNAVKASACWVYKAKTGNSQQKEYKEKGVIDNGCSRHMTRNKCYLTEYEDMNGIKREFSVAKTPQQNGVAERRNKTLIKATRTIDHLGKFDGKADEGFFVGTALCEEDVGMKPTKVNESGASDKGDEDEQDIRSEFERLLQQEKQTNSTIVFNTVDMGGQANLNNLETTMNEPKKVIQSLEDPSWIEAMQEELLQFELQKVFAPVARIEAIRLFLAYASFMGFIVYQMDVKSAFLYGTIKEEVYVCQPPGFEDPHFPNKVYKVEKALYGLHQAPRAWYETLSTYLIKNRFRRCTIDKTLFINKDKGDILLAQLYVDDIIFGSTKKSLCDEFEGLMHKRF